METIKEIRERLAGASSAELPALLLHYQDDTRTSVQKLLAQEEKRREKLEKEWERLDRMKEFEKRYGHLGYLCGIDEVGRGPLAGPVAACAVVLPRDCNILYLNDSKKLTPKKRRELAVQIWREAVSIGMAFVWQDRIDRINILQATYEAMRQAVSQLQVQPAMLLNDAVTIPGIDLPQLPIVKGDTKSISIAAASIVAKVERDEMMEQLDEQYPGYGFASNKGYGTAEHIEALKRLGPCPLHRRSFIEGILGEKKEENLKAAGRAGEAEAAVYLEKHGLRILERNYRCRLGEIDLIVQDSETVVFVEVKNRRRGESGSSLEAVPAEKQKKIARIADYYLTRILKTERVPCRFDVVGIDGGEITWVKNAFQKQSYAH